MPPKLLSKPTATFDLLKVRDQTPFCQRCRRPLPRPTNDPCRDPDCAFQYLSLSALWRIIEDRQRP